MAQRCRKNGTLLVLDECFLDFTDAEEAFTLKKELAEYKNVFILRAFTKMYAMPGLRLGYGFCSDTALLARMMECGQPWSVSVPAQAAGLAALEESEFAERTRRLIAKERLYLRGELGKLGLHVYPAYANYLLFENTRELNLKEALLARGILLRSCADYHGLNAQFYRIAVRTHAENRRLLAELRNLLQEV